MISKEFTKISEFHSSSRRIIELITHIDREIYRNILIKILNKLNLKK